MNLTIKKLTNGYVLSLDGKETFFDVPEAICGATAEWVLNECKRLDAGPTYGDAAANIAQAKVLAQLYAASESPMPWASLGDALSGKR